MSKIVKLKPIGFCNGVNNAYNKINEIILKHNNSKIYLVGWLVHNKQVVDELKRKKIKILDNSSETRYELIKKNKFNKNDVIIFSAHGTDHKTIDLAKEKVNNVYDLTCPFVTKTFSLIKKYNSLNYKILYYGKDKHPEANAAKSFADDFQLIEKKEDIKKIKTSKKIFFLSQTTMNYLEFTKLSNIAKKKWKDIIISNEICNASSLRQKQVIMNENNFDLLIIVGDRISNNTRSLYDTAKALKYKKVLFYSNEKEIKKNDLINFQKIAIVSGTSFNICNLDKIEKKIIKFII